MCLLHVLICSLHNIESGKDIASSDRSFPSWKKEKQRKKKRKEIKKKSFTLWNKNKDTNTICQALVGFWRPCLWSGHAPRSKVLLDEFLVNTVGSSRDGSFGKKNMLEWNVGLHPRHISFYKTANMHVSGDKEPSLSRSPGIFLTGIQGGWRDKKGAVLWPKEVSQFSVPPARLFNHLLLPSLLSLRLVEHLAQTQGT